MVDFATTRTAPRPTGNSLDEWIRWLFWLGHFHYAAGLDEIYRMIHGGDKQLFEDAVASYQGFNWDIRGKQLKVDGQCGMYTMASALPAVRPCIHRDIGHYPFSNGQPRWTQSASNPVRVYWSGSALGLLSQEFYRAAAAEWSRVCGVNIASASSKQSADIWAQGLRIDGASNTLAWSYSPDNNMRTAQGGGTRQLEQRYDTGDISFYSRAGDAQVIATHEVGHALHFDGHTNDSADVMYPSHNGTKDFGQNEIKYMVQAYGPPVTQPPTPQPPGAPGGELQFSPPVELTIDGKPFLFYLAGRSN